MADDLRSSITRETTPDRWWSRKPPEQRRPLLGPRLLWNTFEWRHPWKVVLAVLGGAIAIAMALATVLVATSSNPSDEVTIGGVLGDPARSEAEYGTVEIEPIALAPFQGEAAVGVRAPSVTTDSTGGERVDIGPSDSTRAIVFVAHWDPHSQSAVTQLRAWLETNQLPSGVSLLTVSTSAAPERANWPPSDWLDREGWPTAVLLDDANTTIATGYGLTAFPYWVAVDQDMTVVDQRSGTMSEAELTAWITGLG